MRVLVVVGTRPDAIKLWPVIEMLRDAAVETIVCDTGQHRDLMAQTLPALGLRPDIQLGLTSAGHMPAALVHIIADRVAEIISRKRPDWVVVQGDTSTALAASMAANSTGTRLAHIEAGLRTFDFAAPWPEEQNRCEIAKLADLHFAPTASAAANLQVEGVPDEAIAVTGNTAIDALHRMVARLDEDAALREVALSEIGSLPTGKRLIVVTAHRRENAITFGELANAIVKLAARGDVEVVLPVHPNPAAISLAGMLRGNPAITLLPALSYPACLLLLQRATLVITDSGGVQEEAPSLGLPALVTRVSTERREALDCGAADLVSPDTLCSAASRLLDDPVAYDAMAQVRHPFGDGQAAPRIVARLQQSQASALREVACLA